MTISNNVPSFMQLNDNNLKPLYMQLAEWLEDEILRDNIKEGDKILSMVDLATACKINPITAGKGVSLLESRGVVEKRRGLGMFVSKDAKELIYDYRKNSGLTSIIDDLVIESKILNVSYEQLITIIKKRFKETENDKT